jgi:hypothetical protein
MNFLPSLASFPLSEKQAQFAKSPTDPLFQKDDRVFVVTGVDATGACSGSREWHHPFVATKIESTSGIDLLCGYYVRLK